MMNQQQDQIHMNWSTYRDMFFKQCKTKEFSTHNSKIHCFAWNSLGQKFATGHSDKSIQVYGIETSRLVKTQPFKGHTDIVDRISWHPSDPDQFASVGPDGFLKLWDYRQKKCVSSLQMKGENINLAWAPDAKCIAVGNRSDVLSFHDPRMSLNILQTENFTFEVNEFSWAPPSSGPKDLFLITTGLGSILVYNGRPGHMKKQGSIQATSVSSICLNFAKNGQYFAVGSSDSLVTIWDTHDFVCRRSIGRLEWPVRCISFSANGNFLASSGEDQFIDIACVQSGKQVHRINNPGSPTFVLSWHPVNSMLAYAIESKYDRDQGNVRLLLVSKDVQQTPVSLTG